MERGDLVGMRSRGIETVGRIEELFKPPSSLLALLLKFEEFKPPSSLLALLKFNTPETREALRNPEIERVALISGALF
jgi:hypothetical protein